MSKNQEPSSDKNNTSEWTILYHQPGILKGRGEFLRLMLEDKGISYHQTDQDCYGPNGLMDAFRGSTEAAAKDIPALSFPLMYPPAIWHRPAKTNENNNSNNDEEDQVERNVVVVNQVGACMIYLGDVLGYAPTTSNYAEKAKANAILLNALDYISEGRASFHPVDNRKSYQDQKKEGDAASQIFSQGRMKIYFHHFNKIVQRNCNVGRAPIAGGKTVTYADFALFHVLDATKSQFNSDFYEKAWDKLDMPLLKKYYSWMKSRPNLQAYFQSDRCARKFLILLLFCCMRKGL